MDSRVFIYTIVITIRRFLLQQSSRFRLAVFPAIQTHNDTLEHNYLCKQSNHRSGSGVSGIFLPTAAAALVAIFFPIFCLLAHAAPRTQCSDTYGLADMFLLLAITYCSLKHTFIKNNNILRLCDTKCKQRGNLGCLFRFDDKCNVFYADCSSSRPQ